MGSLFQNTIDYVRENPNGDGNKEYGKYEGGKQEGNRTHGKQKDIFKYIFSIIFICGPIAEGLNLCSHLILPVLRLG